MRTFPGHDGLDKYAGQARYHAVDATYGWDADEAISRLNKRAPTAALLGLCLEADKDRWPPYVTLLHGGRPAFRTPNSLRCCGGVASR